MLIKRLLLVSRVSVLDRQSHHYPGASTNLAVDLEHAAMSSNDLVDEVEPDSRHGNRTDIACATISLPYVINLLGRYTETAILDYDFDEAVLCPRGERNYTPLRRVFEGIR
jgi:hypothetical protein